MTTRKQAALIGRFPWKGGNRGRRRSRCERTRTAIKGLAPVSVIAREREIERKREAVGSLMSPWKVGRMVEDPDGRRRSSSPMEAAPGAARIGREKIQPGEMIINEAILLVGPWG